MRYLFLVTLLFFVSSKTFTQYYSSGSDPARLQWRQIQTPVVRLVFEKNLEKEALRLAAFIDSMAPIIGSTLNHRPGRINLLIHNQTSYSNGFVSWAPKRMEFYSTPNQNTNSIDWLEHLAIHEYRHVVQIDKLNQGFTRILSLALGQQATGGVLGMYLPMWFLEGDAVTTETTLTQSGRGRSFEFNQELKAQLVEKGLYSYDKAYMGSYRNQVPDYYKMGYPMVAMARNEFGPEIWENAVDKTGKAFWLIPNPFNRSLKTKTGMGTKALYEHLFKKLQTEYIRETSEIKPTAYSSIVHPNNDYIDYLYPSVIKDSIIISELKGPGIRSQIAEINLKDGTTIPLAYTGIKEDEPLSANSNYVVWSELKYHPRWENESFSIIRIFNRKTAKTTSLTRKTKYFAPAIHPDNPVIATVEATPDYCFNLVLLDAQTGSIIKTIPSPNNQYILTPSWNTNGNNLVMVLLDPEGKSLWTLDPGSEKWTCIRKPSYDEIRLPAISDNNVWFSAKGNSGEEIFHLDMSDGNEQQLTISKYGAARPTPLASSENLIYSVYTDKGYRPVWWKAADARPDTTLKKQSVIDQLAENLTKQESIPTEVISTTNQYAVKPYSKFNLSGLHSWGPVFYNFQEQGNYSVVGLMSQNLLGTTIVTAGYNADPSLSEEKYQLNLSYRGLYPILDLEIKAGDNQLVQQGLFADQTDTFGLNINENLKYLYLKAGMRLPFDLSSGQYIRYLEPGIKLTLEQRSAYDYTKRYYTQQNNNLTPTRVEETIKVADINFQVMEYSLYFHNLRRGASRDVSYRMGQLVQLVYRNTPWGNYRAGSLFGVRTKLYLPGFAKHHAVSVNNDWQSIKKGRLATAANGDYQRYYRLNNVFSDPRGYSDVYFDQMYTFRSTYMMPLWNPDVALAGLAYIKRIRLNLFYDAARVNYELVRKEDHQLEKFNRNLSSTGLELHADTHFFRFILPFSVGYRMGYRDFDRSFFHNFIFTTSFSGFLVNE